MVKLVLSLLNKSAEKCDYKEIKNLIRNCDNSLGSIYLNWLSEEMEKGEELWDLMERGEIRDVISDVYYNRLEEVVLNLIYNREYEEDVFGDKEWDLRCEMVFDEIKDLEFENREEICEFLNEEFWGRRDMVWEDWYLRDELGFLNWLFENRGDKGKEIFMKWLKEVI